MNDYELAAELGHEIGRCTVRGCCNVWTRTLWVTESGEHDGARVCDAHSGRLAFDDHDLTRIGDIDVDAMAWEDVTADASLFAGITDDLAEAADKLADWMRTHPTDWEIHSDGGWQVLVTDLELVVGLTQTP